MVDIKSKVAVLVSFVKYKAPSEDIVGAVYALEEKLLQQGPISYRVGGILHRLKENVEILPSDVESLEKIITSTIDPRKVTADIQISKELPDDTIVWVYRVKDLLKESCVNNIEKTYPYILGGLYIIRDRIMLSEDYIVLEILNACIASIEERAFKNTSTVLTLISNLIEYMHGYIDREYLISKMNEDESTKRIFKPALTSSGSFASVPAVLVVTPENYTKEEFYYVRRSLNTFLTNYASIQFVDSLDPLPEDIPDSFIIWPGRASLLRVLDPRSVRVFRDREGNLDTTVPIWATKNQTTYDTWENKEQDTDMLSDHYIQRVSRPIVGREGMFMEMATFVTWTLDSFEYLIETLDEQLMYDRNNTYRTADTGSVTIPDNLHRAIEGLAKEPPLYRKGRELPQTENKIPSPYVVLDPSMAEEERLFVEEAIGTHLINIEGILSPGDVLPKDEDFIVYWPGRCIPVKEVDASNAYNFIREGDIQLDKCAPQWLAVKDYKLYREEALEGIAKMAPLHTNEYIAEVNGLVFGKVARKLESVSLLRWGDDSFSYVKDVVDEGFKSVYARV